jgi:hypothetical protein
MMEQAFGKLDAALHSSGKSFYKIVSAIEQSNTSQDFGNSRFELGSTQTVEVSLMPQIFVGGEFGVNALGLKDDSDMAAQGSGLADGVEAGDGGAARSRNHESGKNAEQCGLAAAVRAEESEEFSGLNVEGDAIESGATLVKMHEVANGDDGLARELGWLGGRRKI